MTPSKQERSHGALDPIEPVEAADWALTEGAVAVKSDAVIKSGATAADHKKRFVNLCLLFREFERRPCVPGVLKYVHEQE